MKRDESIWQEEVAGITGGKMGLDGKILAW
jgi:hypothetical protein